MVHLSLTCSSRRQNRLRNGTLILQVRKDGDSSKDRYVGVVQAQDAIYAVYSFLRKYADAHRIPDNALLFPISVRQVQHHLKLVCDHLGYENISTHSFRKWYATSIYNANGHDIVLVQRLLQHSSPMVTRRYIGVSDEQMEQAIARHVNIISA